MIIYMLYDFKTFHYLFFHARFVNKIIPLSMTAVSYKTFEIILGFHS